MNCGQCSEAVAIALVSEGKLIKSWCVSFKWEQLEIGGKRRADGQPHIDD